jgi:hypothetical protein
MKKGLLLFFMVFIVVVSMVRLFIFDSAFNTQLLITTGASGIVSTFLFWVIAFKLIKR